MFLVHNPGSEYSFAVGLKLSSKEVDVFGEVRVAEAGCSTVEKNTPSSVPCKIKKRPTLSLDI